MTDINLLEIFRQSPTLLVLFVCSILSVAFAFERFMYIRKADVDGNELLGRVRKMLEGGKVDEAQGFLAKHPAALARVIHYGLAHRNLKRDDLEELLGTARLEERLKLERYLGILGTMGNSAPFIGLFGTVVGIIKAFRDLALAGTGGPTVVAKGIAEALVATAGGLLVAIPAAVLYNYFQRRVKTMSTEMEVYSTRLLVMMGAK
ncbi:MAG: MotA/TolQ/ExbB proton channel family protein [Elusimicrobia bacterium]|nr:MotA/TolQ/ExbB proton channel family protein [Elusimicrobiota bacterium]